MKIVCQAEAGDEPEELVDNSKGPRVGTKQYLNVVSPIQYMNVWIPAHWAPVVMEVEWPGVYDPSVLHGKFFDNVGQSDHTQDSQYQGSHWWWVLQRFRANQCFMAQRLTISEPWGFVWICIGETWGVFTLGDTRK